MVFRCRETPLINREGQPWAALLLHSHDFLGGLLCHNCHFTVVVAVVAIGKVQMAVDKVVDVVAVRNGLVAAVGAMSVGSVMTATVVALSAASGVCLAYLEHVLIDMAFMRAVEVAVVEVVDMIVVLDGSVAAVGTVLVGVVLVDLVVKGHDRCVLFYAPRRRAGVVVFTGMRKSVENQVRHVLICQVIKHVLALALAAHDVVGTEHAKALRDGGDGLRFRQSKL